MCIWSDRLIWVGFNLNPPVLTQPGLNTDSECPHTTQVNGIIWIEVGYCKCYAPPLPERGGGGEGEGGA